MKKDKRYKQQVRIIGGSHRRRLIQFAEAEGLRPTPDRVREQVFNWLGQRLTGLRVLDLFGGSGVMGLEAASRGAAQVDIIELNSLTAKSIAQNVRDLDFANVRVHQKNASQFLQDASLNAYDVILIDPPYKWQDWALLWPLLSHICHEQTQLYIEAASLPDLPEWLEWMRQGSAGQSHYGLAVMQSIDL